MEWQLHPPGDLLGRPSHSKAVSDVGAKVGGALDPRPAQLSGPGSAPSADWPLAIGIAVKPQLPVDGSPITPQMPGNLDHWQTYFDDGGHLPLIAACIGEPVVLQVIVLVRHQDGEDDPSPEFVQFLDRLARNPTDDIGDVRVEPAFFALPFQRGARGDIGNARLSAPPGSCSKRCSSVRKRSSSTNRGMGGVRSDSGSIS